MWMPLFLYTIHLYRAGSRDAGSPPGYGVAQCNGGGHGPRVTLALKALSFPFDLAGVFR